MISLPSLNTELTKRLFKFGIVGFSGILIDFGSTYFLKENIGVNAYLANSIGFCLAAFSNYLLNRVWTFKDKNNLILQQFGMFFIISLIGLVLNNILIYVLNTYLGLSFYIAKFLAISIVFFWNYFANAKFTFRKKEAIGTTNPKIVKTEQPIL